MINTMIHDGLFTFILVMSTARFGWDLYKDLKASIPSPGFFHGIAMTVAALLGLWT